MLIIITEIVNYNLCFPCDSVYCGTTDLDNKGGKLIIITDIVNYYLCVLCDSIYRGTTDLDNKACK